jgi:hypothetical protein
MRITKSFVDQMVPPSPKDNGKNNKASYRDSAITGSSDSN